MADASPSPQLVAQAIRALPASVPAPDQCIDHDGAVSLLKQLEGVIGDR